MVLDPVAAVFLNLPLRALGRGGTLSNVRPRRRRDLVHPTEPGCCVKGNHARGMEIRTFFTDHPDEALRDTAELQQMFDEGRVRPYIGARFPLDQAAAALRHVADRRALSKVVIDILPTTPKNVRLGSEKPETSAPFRPIGSDRSSSRHPPAVPVPAESDENGGSYSNNFAQNVRFGVVGLPGAGQAVTP